jgi:protein-L-isoaspartate(D-aspartate) O-methyltransferase
MLVGRILQCLALCGGEAMLEIGTGSGYLSACLAQLGGRLRSLELHAEIADFARANLRAAAPSLPIEVISADAMQLEEESRYDVIVLTASLPIYQARFERALRPDGRMFVVLGATTLQQATLVRRIGSGGCYSEPLFETCIEPLEHAPRPAVFGF